MNLTGLLIGIMFGLLLGWFTGEGIFLIASKLLNRQAARGFYER